MKMFSAVVCFLLILVFAGAGPCLSAPQGAVEAVHKTSSRPPKVAYPQTGVVAQQLELCRKKLEALKGSATQLTKEWCGKPSSTKYLNLLKEREDSCRGILLSAQEQAGYKKVDQDLASFAERCDCGKKMESINANAQTLTKLQDSRCFEGKDAYDSAIKNVKAIVAEWDMICKGVVSNSFQQKFVSKQNEFIHLQADIQRTCMDAGHCQRALNDYKTGTSMLEKIRYDSCRGKLHEALGSADSLRKTANMSCGLYRNETQKLFDQFLDQYKETIKYCSSQNIVMVERCPYTREVITKSSKTMGTYSKSNEVYVHEYWCHHQGDMPWCLKYEAANISQEKNWYGVAADKENVVKVRLCVPPSEWKDKCKAWTSSGKCIPKD